MALVQTYGKCNLGKYTMIDLQILRGITWMLLTNKLMALDLYILSWKTLFRVSGKVSEEALTEEEQLNDLLLLIKLLTNLLSKDILDFGSGQ